MRHCVILRMMCARRAVGVRLVVSALLAAGCSGGGSGRPVAATVAGVRRLWQASGLVRPLLVGGAVVGSSSDGHRSVIDAVSVTTGHPKWSFRVPAAQPIVMGTLAADGVVVAEVGHFAHTRMGNEIPRDFIVLDAQSGRRLWTAPIGGTWGTPSYAVAGGLLVTGDRLGTLTARALRSGAVSWRRVRPTSCKLLGDQQYDEALVGDGALLAVSYQCRPDVYRGTLVQRLTASNGALQWQWATPRRSAAETVWGTVQVASESGNIVVLGGGVPTDGARFASAQADTKSWRADLESSNQRSALLAFDAHSGRLRWTEVGGGQPEQLTVADGAVCESVDTGFECRDDVTGAPTRAVYRSIRPGPRRPDSDEAFAGIGRDLAAVTTAAPEDTRLSVEVMQVREQGILAAVTTTVDAFTTYGSTSAYGAVVVGTGPLPGDADPGAAAPSGCHRLPAARAGRVAPPGALNAPDRAVGCR